MSQNPPEPREVRSPFAKVERQDFSTSPEAGEAFVKDFGPLVRPVEDTLDEIVPFRPAASSPAPEPAASSTSVTPKVTPKQASASSALPAPPAPSPTPVTPPVAKANTPPKV